MNILQKEYGLDPRQLYGGAADQMLGFLVIALTQYEMNSQDQRSLRAFQKSEDKLFGPVGDKSHDFSHSRSAFQQFGSEYAKAVREYATSKQKSEDAQKVALAQQQAKAAQEKAETQRSTEEADRKAAEVARQEKDLADAQAASAQAKRDIQASAAQKAIARQRTLRAQKLQEVLASPGYKRWEVSLQVRQGEQMISQAQDVLNHENQVEKASGIVNLAARRAAGEQIVAGKDLVDQAFDLYKKLGGTATTPDLVDPGTDPAAPYR